MRYFLFTLLLVAMGSAHAQTERPPQFVMLAFDGSKSLSFWNESRQLAKTTTVKFTYFISGVYFLTPANRTIYRPPLLAAGRSDVGFGSSAGDILQRMNQIVLATEEGHEMASHANGHFDGSRWTREQWIQEFTQFRSLLDQVTINNRIQMNPDDSTRWLASVKTAHLGFRAPLLATSRGLWEALESERALYDTSGTAAPTAWPTLSRFGFWNFPLAQVRIAGTCKAALSMDYNFYVAQSRAKSDPANAIAYEEQMLKTYMEYFERNYNGNRAPIHIGHHFSKWNDGAYWKAMQRFAKNVCSKPGVRCATYSELASYMTENRSEIERWVAKTKALPDSGAAACKNKLMVVPGALTFDPPEAHIEEE